MQLVLSQYDELQFFGQINVLDCCNGVHNGQINGYKDYKMKQCTNNWMADEQIEIWTDKQMERQTERYANKS